MTIQYLSDLHLEFPANKLFIEKNPIIPVGDILILAGDIVPFSRIDLHQDFFDYVSKNFKFVYWVPGNHEYYHFDLSEKQGQFKDAIRENVFLVNNTCVKHGNFKIIFSTLWTNISLDKAWVIENSMNDFQLIKDGNKRFSYLKYNELHEESLDFIIQNARSENQEKLIVVTHHIPTFLNYPKEYKNSSINEAFAVDLEKLIEESNIDYWIYGHHHRNVEDFQIGNTMLLTNQLGYCQYNEHLFYKNGKII